jgi:hypothetical protein
MLLFFQNDVLVNDVDILLMDLKQRKFILLVFHSVMHYFRLMINQFLLIPNEFAFYRNPDKVALSVYHHCRLQSIEAI